MRRHNKTRVAVVAGVTLVSLGLTIPASAARPVLHWSQGTTLAEVRQQAAAEAVRPAGVQKKIDQLAARGMGMKSDTATVPAEASAMAGMAMSTTSSVVTGPTNLATSVGGSWNNYAFTIPNAPHATGTNGSAGAVHAVQLYNGDVLIMAGSGNQWQNLPAGDFTTWLWNPTLVDQTKAWTLIPTPYDMFCSGHVELPDGNILIAGGTTAYPQYDANGNLVHDWNGSKQSYIFDVATSSYVQTGSMPNARWYPTLVSTGTGQVIAVGGLDDQAANLGVVSHNTDTVNSYNPTTGVWSQLPAMDFTLTDPSQKTAAGATNSTRTFPYYPGLVLTADGRLFYSGESNGDNGVQSGLWNYTTGAFQNTGQLSYAYQRNAGATVLLPPAQSQKVMVLGGGDYSLPTTNSTEIINLAGPTPTTDAANPTWTAGPNLSAAKMYVGAVILPDYTVFETNGASEFRQGGVHTAETYNPATNAFTVDNSPNQDRLYHSNAFLEPNGTVAIMGSQPLDGSFDMNISIYSPPYLFKGARPTVSSTFKTFGYSGTAQGKFTVNLAAGTTLAHASLIRPSATTHSTDPDQRLINLAITKNADGTYSFTPPTNDNMAPAGQYMLFVTDSTGVPSVADWVSIGTPLAGGSTPPPPPPPTGMAISATQVNWIGTFTLTSPTPGDLYLQEDENGVWTNCTNYPSNAQGVSTVTWGGGGTFQFRSSDPATGQVSPAITVTYGTAPGGPWSSS
jgi:hypothetical protein